MAPPLLYLKDIRLTIGGKPLLDGASLTVSPGERLCLVGRNGSGKSTLLKIAAAELEADKGERFLQPGAVLRYLPQEPDLSGFKRVMDYVEAGLGPDNYMAPYLLDQLGLTGEEDPAVMSGGEIRRAALARVLAAQPDILMLDEPTNHLDLPTIEWLEQELASMRSALVLISHDRRFLQSLSKATLWLDRGITQRLDKGFGDFEAWRDEILEKEELDRHKLARQINNEEHWIRHGVSGRRKRNVGRVARLAEMRSEFRDARKAMGSVKLEATEGKFAGALVIEAKNISKSFGDRTIIQDFSARIVRGDRLGIVGANGAGKTTLIRLITGAMEPDSGTVKLAQTLEVGSLDQILETKGDVTLQDFLASGREWIEINGQKKHVISYMKDFLFAPEQARTPISRLSGGERRRLMLARALSLPSSLLVLDEPTNDLDLETLDLLQEMISDYAGTVLVVSHDRDFLDRVATSILVSEGEGVWGQYAGGYSDMLIQRGAPIGARKVEEVPEVKAADKQTTAPTPAQNGKRRLSFKEKFALESLPKEMEKLELTKSQLETKLADPAIYDREPAQFNKLSTQLKGIIADLAKAEQAWLELEMLRLEIEG